MGGLILALSDEPQSTRAWAIGAEGERRLAAHLDRLSGRGVHLLHDRRIPPGRANIDHIAVSSAGVFVIDAKHYRGRPRLRTEGGILRPRVTTLRVGNRDCTRLVAGAHRQVQAVRSALESAGIDLPVLGMLCFVAADWPLIGGAFEVEGVRVLWPKKADQAILTPGPLSAEQIGRVVAVLTRSFPAA